MDNFEYGKLAYTKYEDLENKLNFLKQKVNSNTSSQTQSSTIIVGGMYGVGPTTKKWLSFNVEKDKEINYLIQLNIINSSRNETFEGVILFDDKVVSTKLFIVSNGLAKVLYDFNYTSIKEIIDVKIVLTPASQDTEFCFDSLIVQANIETLTHDFVCGYEEPKSNRLSLACMGEKNYRDIGKNYGIAFSQNETIYTTYMSQKTFDLQKLDYLTAEDSEFFCCRTTYKNINNEDGFNDLITNSWLADKNTLSSKNLITGESLSLYFNYRLIDGAAYKSTANAIIDGLLILRNINLEKVSIIETFGNAPMNATHLNLPDYNYVKGLYIAKPLNTEFIKNRHPIAVLDNGKTALIAYNDTHFNNSKIFTINDVDELYMQYGATVNDLKVYASINNKTYIYNLVYDETIQNYTQSSVVDLGNIDMVYPGFDKDIFVLKNGKIYFTHNRDLFFENL